MPKIKQLEAQYATRDFWAELDGQSGRKGLRSNAALGSAIGITGQCVGKYRSNPSPMKLETMQKIIRLLKPDIGVVLKFLGYSDKEIKAFVSQR